MVEQKEGVSNRKKAEMWVRHLEQKKEDVLRSLDVLKFIPDDLRAPEAQRLFFHVNAGRPSTPGRGYPAGDPRGRNHQEVMAIDVLNGRFSEYLQEIGKKFEREVAELGAEISRIQSSGFHEERGDVYVDPYNVDNSEADRKFYERMAALVEQSGSGYVVSALGIEGETLRREVPLETQFQNADWKLKPVNDLNKNISEMVFKDDTWFVELVTYGNAEDGSDDYQQCLGFATYDEAINCFEDKEKFNERLQARSSNTEELNKMRGVKRVKRRKEGDDDLVKVQEER